MTESSNSTDFQQNAMSSHVRHGEHWSNQISKIGADTPYMAVDLGIIREKCRQFKSLFPRVTFFYAIKALSDREVIQVVNEYVDGFDVASIEEIEALLSLGIAPNRLGFNNPVKPAKSIEKAYGYGLRDFSCQSRQEIEKLAAYAPGSNIYVRVKMDDSHSAVPLSTKYGCDMDDVSSLLQYAKELSLKPVGLTFHVGSQQTSFEVWLSDITNARSILAEVNELGIAANTINIGGGLPAKYEANDPAIEDVAQVINHALGDDNTMRYISEPGRFVVANSSVIVSSVIGKEKRNDQNWLYLDAGLFQAFLGASRFHPFPYPPYSLRHDTQGDQKMEQYILTGPSCDSQDIIARDIWLPADITIDDKIVFPNTGAYTVVYGSEFNGFKPPRRVFIDSTQADH